MLGIHKGLRLLFADEAMAGLSPSEVEEIIAVLIRLNGQGITIVFALIFVVLNILIDLSYAAINPRVRQQ